MSTTDEPEWQKPGPYDPRPHLNRAQKRALERVFRTTMAPDDCEECDAYLNLHGRRLTAAIGETAIMAGITVEEAIQLFINGFHAADHDATVAPGTETPPNPSMN